MRNVPGPLRSALCIAAAFLAPAPSDAFTLDLPSNAVEAGQDARAADQILFPVGPRTGTGGQGLVAEGRIDRRAWILPESDATPFQILDPILDQLSALGFVPRYSCRDRECGGFDFRLALDLLPAPAMHVDLGDFRYITAQRESSAGAEVVSLVASRSETGGHLHLTIVSPQDADTVLQTTQTAATIATDVSADSDLASVLASAGRVVLADLEFRPGSSELGDGPFQTLDDLAAWLAANPEATVVLVGHSDNVGGLEDNIRLSERRAAAVVAALTNDFGVSGARLASRGVGYLSPIASNDTDEGRLRNRRVEVVIGAP